MKKFGISFLLLFLLLLWLPCYASTPTPSEKNPQGVILTWEEYQVLRNNLKELSEINLNSQKGLNRSKSQLKISQEKLLQLENQLESLQTLCKDLQTKTKEQEDLLQSANKYLEMQKKELKKERQRIKVQRNIAYAVAVVSLVGLIKHF